MTDNTTDTTILQQQVQIEAAITRLFAAEDEGLKYALTAAKEAGLPQIAISPMQGKFLQVLATACNARKILEIHEQFLEERRNIQNRV